MTWNCARPRPRVTPGSPVVRATYSSVILVDRPHGRTFAPNVHASNGMAATAPRSNCSYFTMGCSHGVTGDAARTYQPSSSSSSDVEGLADELGTQDAVGSLEVHVNPVAGAVPEIRGHVRSQREIGNDAVGRAGDAQDRGVGVRGHVLPVAVEDTGSEGGEPAHGVVRHDPDVPLRRQGVHDEGAVRGLDVRQRGDELAGERGLELADLNAERLLRPPDVGILERDAGTPAGTARPELALHPPAHVARDAAGGAEPRAVDGPGEADLILIRLSRLHVPTPPHRRWCGLATLGGEGGGGEMEQRGGDEQPSDHGRLLLPRRGFQRIARRTDRQPVAYPPISTCAVAATVTHSPRAGIASPRRSRTSTRPRPISPTTWR